MPVPDNLGAFLFWCVAGWLVPVGGVLWIMHWYGKVMRDDL